MAKEVIVACDFSSAAETIDFLNRLSRPGESHPPFVKIGMELFYKEGPAIVREVKARGHRVFLDLKLYDIPNTVRQAMKNLALLGVDMTNVHAAGGTEMMVAARQGLEEGSGGIRPLLIAVTILTSIGEAQMQREMQIHKPLDEVVALYAGTAGRAGLDGVVCSPLEAAGVKARCGHDFLTVTPGVRFQDGDVGDQSRVTTPADAAKLGSDYIVVGRPITQAQNPGAAYRRARSEFLGE